MKPGATARPVDVDHLAALERLRRELGDAAVADAERQHRVEPALGIEHATVREHEVVGLDRVGGLAAAGPGIVSAPAAPRRLAARAAGEQRGTRPRESARVRTSPQAIASTSPQASAVARVDRARR